MRTPSRYGKRQRLTNQYQVVWNEVIDAETDKDSQASKSEPGIPLSSTTQGDSTDIWLYKQSLKDKSSVSSVSETTAIRAPMQTIRAEYRESNPFSGTRQDSSPSVAFTNTTSLEDSLPAELEHKSRPAPSSASVRLSAKKNKSLTPKVMSSASTTRPRRFRHHGSSDKGISHDVPIQVEKEADLLTVSLEDASNIGPRSEMKTNEWATNTRPDAESAEFLIAGRQMQHSRLQDAAELDLEPILRPLTPPSRTHMAGYFSPHVSPASKDIFRVFDTETTASPKRSRRLFTLMKTDAVPNVDDYLYSPNRKAQKAVEMVEAAEDNLNKFFQTTNDESSHREQQSKSTENTDDHEMKQDYNELTRPVRSTYSKQRSFLLEEPEALIILQPEDSHKCGTAIDAVLNVETPTIEVKSVRNVHDLRHRGEHKRFIDDMSYFLEGLCSVSTAQSTLLELAHKLTSSTFAKKFATYHNEFDIIAQLSDVTEPLSLAASLTIITVLNQNDVVSKECKITEELVQRSMSFNKDLTYYVASKTGRVAKINQQAVAQLRDDLAHSEALKAHCKVCVSPRLLGLMTAAACSPISPQLTRKIGHTVLSESLKSQTVPLELYLAATLMESASTSGTGPMDTKDIDVVSEALLSTCSMPYSYLRTTTISTLLRHLIHSETTNTSSTRALSTISFLTGLVDFVLAAAGGIEDSREDLVLAFGLLVSLMEDSSIARNLVESKLPKYGSRFRSVLAKRLQQRLSTESLNRTLTGYHALLSFYLRKDDLNGGKDYQLADTECIRKGLSMLKAETTDLSGSKEFVSTISNILETL